MEQIISSEKGINSVWLINDTNPNLITRNRVVITDAVMFRNLVDELRDIRHYVYVHTIETGYVKDHILYTFEGAEKNEKVVSLGSGNTITYTISYYKNPRSMAYRLITGNLYSDNDDLLDLFMTEELYGYKTKECLREFRTALNLIQILESSSLDAKSIKRLLKRMWPSFGYYAVEGLKCTDIEMIEQYDISQLEIDCFKNSDAREILINKDLAKSNGKVLSLARRAYNLTNNKR